MSEAIKPLKTSKFAVLDVGNGNNSAGNFIKMITNNNDIVLIFN